jgi:ADP-dependent NAD(P)H-hydrate dehydratase
MTSSRATRGPTTSLTARTLRRWPLPDSGKGKRDRGTVLVIAGARQTPGAAILAATAALRAGAGTLQIATAASVAATT